MVSPLPSVDSRLFVRAGSQAIDKNQDPQQTSRCHIGSTPASSRQMRAWTHRNCRRASATYPGRWRALSAIKGFVCFLVAYTLASTGFSRQNVDNAGRVTGVVFVRDSSGGRSFVGGATVKLSGPVVLETQTDEKGNYASPPVAPGTYQIEVLFSGLQAAQTITVEHDKGVLAELQLKPAEVKSSVTVSECGRNERLCHVLNASYVRSRAFGDLNDFNQFFGTFAQPVIQPNARGRLSFDAPNRFLFWGTLAAPWKLTLVPVYEVHTGFPYSVENEFREYVGPRNVARFPRFSSFDLQITRPLTLPFGEKHLHARVGMGVFNLFNHFDPRDVQNNLASARFGQLFNTAWREYRGKFVMEF